MKKSAGFRLCTLLYWLLMVGVSVRMDDVMGVATTLFTNKNPQMFCGLFLSSDIIDDHQIVTEDNKAAVVNHIYSLYVMAGPFVIRR